jgi:hypothetical protein
MKRRQLFLVMAVLFAFLSLSASTASAADSVAITTATGGVLKIDGNGTYGVDATRTLVAVTWTAKEQTTGQVSVIIARAAGGTWSSTLNLVAGKYTVKAILTTTDGTNMFDTESTPIKDITVTAGP